MLKPADSFFAFLLLGSTSQFNEGYLHGKNRQLRQDKSSHDKMVTRIGRNVFYVARKSDRETIFEQFSHWNNYTKKL